MSKVEEFLMKYNPEGVDNIPLWELTAWDKKFNAVDKSMQKKVIKYKYYLAKDLDALVDDTGDIRILYTNEKVAYTSEEKCKGNICEGEIVAIPWGGTPTVKYYNGKFVTGDNRIATSLDTKILNNKYLFYWMISQLGTIADFYRGAGIQHPSMISVLSMQIPLPHIKVQEEIVKILDSFTNLIDALNEELSLRQKQFEYYREKLLTFKTNGKDIVFDILENIAPYSKKRINSEMLNAENYVGVDNLLQNKEGKDISTSVPNSGNWTRYDEGDILVGNIRPYLKKIWIADRTGGASGDVLVFSLKDKSLLLPKYLYYLLSSDEFFEYDNNSARGAGMPRGDKKVICRYSIAFPKDKSIQQSIVEKLDAFESLISSLKEEIALRQKQYEYYREKLLTFD